MKPEDAPVFREPWEAEAFALAVKLHEAGVFTWPEWAAALAEEIKRAQAAGDPDQGDTYYRHWLAALERLVAGKHLSDQAELARYRDAWKRAADRTPHGSPIQLAPQDFAFIAELKPEIVILGTGSRQRFPGPELGRALAACGAGVEIMDTRAPCRTYNILASEGRKVAAAVLIG